MNPEVEGKGREEIRMSRSSAEVEWRSEPEPALNFRHSDEIKLRVGVGRISSVRLDFPALRAELSGEWAHFEYSDA